MLGKKEGAQETLGRKNNPPFPLVIIPMPPPPFPLPHLPGKPLKD